MKKLIYINLIVIALFCYNCSSKQAKIEANKIKFTDLKECKPCSDKLKDTLSFFEYNIAYANCDFLDTFKNTNISLKYIITEGENYKIKWKNKDLEFTTNENFDFLPSVILELDLFTNNAIILRKSYGSGQAYCVILPLLKDYKYKSYNFVSDIDTANNLILYFKDNNNSNPFIENYLTKKQTEINLLKIDSKIYFYSPLEIEVENNKVTIYHSYQKEFIGTFDLPKYMFEN